PHPSPPAELLPLHAAQSLATVPSSPPRQSMPRAAPHARPHETAQKKPLPESAPPAGPHSPCCTPAARPETHPSRYVQTDRTYGAAASCAATLPLAACRMIPCPTANSNARNHLHPAESCSEAYSCAARGRSRETAHSVARRGSA